MKTNPRMVELMQDAREIVVDVFGADWTYRYSIALPVEDKILHAGRAWLKGAVSPDDVFDHQVIVYGINEGNACEDDILDDEDRVVGHWRVKHIIPMES